MLTAGLFGITGSRYIYDLYYEKEAISKKLYDWLLKNNYADANLIAKWKKQGYEKVTPPPPPPAFPQIPHPPPYHIPLANVSTCCAIQLCCLRCIQTKETNFNATCKCRVPKSQMQDEEFQCFSCGCRGCASGD